MEDILWVQIHVELKYRHWIIHTGLCSEPETEPPFMLHGFLKEPKETLHRFWNSERPAVLEDVATDKGEKQHHFVHLKHANVWHHSQSSSDRFIQNPFGQVVYVCAYDLTYAFNVVCFW